MFRNCLVFIACIVFSHDLQGQSKTDEYVIQLMNALNQAIIDTDSMRLSALVWDDLSYGHSSGLVQNKAAFVSGVLHGANRFKRFDLQNQTVDVHGRTAVLRHTATAQAINQGNEIEIRFGNILVWQKRKGLWRLLARQGYKI